MPRDLGLRRYAGASVPIRRSLPGPESTGYPEFHYQFGIDLFIAGVEAVAASPT